MGTTRVALDTVIAAFDENSSAEAVYFGRGARDMIVFRLQIVIATLVLLGGACRDTERAPQHSGADTVIERFLTEPIRGSRPFENVRSYLRWLADGPTMSQWTIGARPTGATMWMVQVTLSGDNGDVTAAECSFDAINGFEHGTVWFACPELSALWTAHAPSSVPALADARPFLPPVPYFLPEPAPGSYQLERLELPRTPEDASANPFVLTAVYVDEFGAEVRLMQQPAGLNGPVFPAFNACEARRLTAGRCRVFTAMASYLLLTTNDAADDVLVQFEQRIRR